MNHSINKAWLAALLVLPLALVGCQPPGPPTTGSLSGKLKPAPSYRFASTPAADALPADALPADLVGSFEFVPGEAVLRLKPGVRPLSGGEPVRLERTIAPGRGVARLAGVGAQGVVRPQSASGQATLRWIAELRRRPEVAYAEPNYIYRKATVPVPNDPLAPLQTHYGLANIPAAWDSATGTTGSSSVVVAVLDTGILWSEADPGKRHPDFGCTVQPGNLPKLVPGYDFVDGDSNPYDESNFAVSEFHGTHVAGTVGACANNGLGGTGVAWNTRIMPVRLIDETGNTTLAEVARGLRWAVGLPVEGTPANPARAQVVNLSLGCFQPCSASQALQDEIDAANAAGSVVVVVSGNENDDSSLYAPSNQRDVIVVGAVGPRRESLESRAPYSNYGPGVSVVAPGGDTRGGQPGNGVLSTLGCGPEGKGSPPCGPAGFGYGYLQGTSMAGPHVSGIVALMMAKQPSLANPAPSERARTWARVLSYLAGTASATGLGDCEQGCGAGLVNAAAAVTRASALPPLGPLLVVNGGGLDFAAGGTSSVITVRNVGDAPAAWSAAAAGPGLSVSAVSRSPLEPGGEGQVTVSLNRAGLAAGGNAGRVIISVPGSGRPSLDVRVYYTQPGLADVGQLRLRLYRKDASLSDEKGRYRLNCPATVLTFPYSYRFEKLEPGSYDLVAYRPRTTNADGTVTVDQLGEVEGLAVEVGQTLAVPEIELNPSAITIRSEAASSCEKK